MDIKSPTKEERIAFHYRGIKMILVTLLLGVLAGLLSSPYFLSQPIYVPAMQEGGPDYASSALIAMHNAVVVTPNTALPAGSYSIPDPSLLTANLTMFANATFLTPGANVTYTNVIITPANAAHTILNGTLVLNNATVQLTKSSDVPSNASYLLINGVVMLSDPSDTGNATVMIGGPTARQTNPHAPNNSGFAFLILALAIYAQKFIFPPLGIDSKKFGFKDWFFLSFMTFCFWFITWTFLLNGQPPAFGPFF